jgi:hypothetical protein
MRSKFKGKYLEIEPIGNSAYLLITWRDASIPPCRRVSDTSRHLCGRSLPEVGVLNRNIAGSARLVSYGTGPGYIGWDYVAWRAGTKSANLAQPCLKLWLLLYLVHHSFQSRFPPSMV